MKAETFIRALKEHEETTRKVLKEQSKQFEMIVNALHRSIESLTDPKDKLIALQLLAEYGNLAIKTLGETSNNLLSNLPNPEKLLSK